MKKMRTFWKNNIREIKHGLGRFFSVFAIVALGTGFLAGLSATSPDMLLSVDKYYDENEMYDLQVLSTMGLTEADVAAIAGVHGVDAVMPCYRTDAMVEADVSLAARLYSIPPQEIGNRWLSQVTILEGRLPQESHECVAVKLKNISAIPAIGSEIVISEETDTEGILAHRTLTVTGIVDSPANFSIEKDRTTIGGGTITMILYLPDSAFTMEYYTEIHATVRGAKDLMCFDAAYLDKVGAVQEAVEAIAAERCTARLEEVTAEPRQELADGWATLETERADADKQLTDAKTALDAAKSDLDNAQAELDANAAQLRAAGYPEAVITEQLAAAQAQIDAGWTEYETNLAAYEESKAESDKAFAEAEAELVKAQEELDALTPPEWYVQTREDNPSYASFDANSAKIAAIAVVFPIFFFMVAALVALTTMTRMVEEQRIQIGTLKALGYSNATIAGKYILYAGFATLLGSVVGLSVGMQLFPRILWNAYGIMYNLPTFYAPFRIPEALAAFLSCFACTTLAAFLACRQSLKESAASLMLPKAPKAGKRVLLEHIPFLWKRMKFTHKVTVRNLMRYKKRFFMTVVGIAGCTALLLTGFGLSDSINEIMDKQYTELNHYDMLLMLHEEDGLEDADVQAVFQRQPPEQVGLVHQELCTFEANADDVEGYLFVPDDVTTFHELLTTRSRKSGELLHLSADTVILTEKAAETLGLRVRDRMTLRMSDDTTVEVTIGGICENYVGSYVYMAPELHASLFTEPPSYTTALLRMPTHGTPDESGLHADMAVSLLECDSIAMLTLVSDMQDSFRNMVTSIDYIILVLIICAGLLAFVVLYNLMNINITERQRELATIKVLGFYEHEVGAYIYRETLILSAIGTAVGLVFGIFLHAFVVRTAEVDMAMFGREIAVSSFVYAGILTMVFSALVCLIMAPKLRKIDMVESLKSVE